MLIASLGLRIADDRTKSVVLQATEVVKFRWRNLDSGHEPTGRCPARGRPLPGLPVLDVVIKEHRIGVGRFGAVAVSSGAVTGGAGGCWLRERGCGFRCRGRRTFVDQSCGP